jgi:hypothetical protein
MKKKDHQHQELLQKFLNFQKKITIVKLNLKNIQNVGSKKQNDLPN